MVSGEAGKHETSAPDDIVALGTRRRRPFALDTAAIGGLVGSVGGFAPFVIAQLRGGDAVLGEAAVRAMQTLVARGAAGIASRVGVGLGWKLGAVDGVSFLNHEGGGPGFTSETRIYPATGLGMVLCMNRWMMPTKTHLVAHRLCEIIRSRTPPRRS